MNSQNKYYDTVYFDSDQEEEPQHEESIDHSNSDQDQRKQLTNDELLYDPHQDEKDEAWVAAQIKQATTYKGSKPDNVARTDAILSCPMCFSPLCYSCQRHESYSNQFRAMFVTNCQVNKKERYRYPESTSSATNEAYYVVKCDTCDTHVAMMDEDEVYHFFNVIAN
ncbi:E2F-associated phosphoprotein-domain-containing protein [Halteromyces radiatus]|uniref:E2F-associated phosphoprotein-domain-containing protein n=1 Tax=Halteromyces radiatus TaxID=101107 RepID=UPI00221FB788|nr:E2F-associated phosphoprotein-domain-containing protein [Halteromyces radiatus]KAI8084640.1 E2F-associated phosphoprotein-domain-containing protein [Halteromyces radiatus]